MKAAGILIVCGELALFLKRGAGGDHPLEWCFPGGKLEEGETLEECAIRETLEESGIEISAEDLIRLSRSCGPDPANVTEPTEAGADVVDFTTFLAKISEPRLPVLDNESVGYCWAPLASPPEPLHPGCRGSLVRVWGNELDIARAMSVGDLSSPQVYKNVHLWKIRLTGTGVAFRPQLDEYVFRRKEDYLNQDFLDRCNGLPVVLYHPEKATLNSEEFAKKSVGSVFLPFIQNDEVWAVAKVFDDATNEAMLADPASTSPGVVLSGEDDVKLETEDGKKILIEGKPSLLDHIALLPKSALGVWDKGGPAAGVDRSAVMNDSAPVPLDLNSIRSLREKALIAELRFATRNRSRRSAGKSF